MVNCCRCCGCSVCAVWRRAPSGKRKREKILLGCSWPLMARPSHCKVCKVWFTHTVSDLSLCSIFIEGMIDLRPFAMKTSILTILTKTQMRPICDEWPCCCVLFSSDWSKLPSLRMALSVRRCLACSALVNGTLWLWWRVIEFIGLGIYLFTNKNQTDLKWLGMSQLQAERREGKCNALDVWNLTMEWFSFRWNSMCLIDCQESWMIFSRLILRLHLHCRSDSDSKHF